MCYNSKLQEKLVDCTESEPMSTYCVHDLPGQNDMTYSSSGWLFDADSDQEEEEDVEEDVEEDIDDGDEEDEDDDAQPA